MGGECSHHCDCMWVLLKILLIHVKRMQNVGQLLSSAPGSSDSKSGNVMRGMSLLRWLTTVFVLCEL